MPSGACTCRNTRGQCCPDDARAWRRSRLSRAVTYLKTGDSEDTQDGVGSDGEGDGTYSIGI